MTSNICNALEMQLRPWRKKKEAFNWWTFPVPLCSHAALCLLSLWLTSPLFTPKQQQSSAFFIWEKFVEKMNKPQNLPSHCWQNSSPVLMAPFPPLWRRTLGSEKGSDFTQLVPSKTLHSLNGAFPLIPIFHEQGFTGVCWLASHCMENQTF